MGGLVEQQIQDALHALATGDMRLADQVVEKDHHVNALEISIDEDCTHIIARRQPAAGDLRMVMTVVKLITDIERIGDESDKVARMAKLIHTTDRLHAPRLADINHVANLALDMLRRVLDAFARMDTKNGYSGFATRRSSGRGLSRDFAAVAHLHDGRSAHNFRIARHFVHHKSY